MKMSSLQLLRPFLLTFVTFASTCTFCSTSSSINPSSSHENLPIPSAPTHLVNHQIRFSPPIHHPLPPVIQSLRYPRQSPRSNRPYYGRVGSSRSVIMSSPSSSSVFIPRALWMDPLDYPVPPFISSHPLHLSQGYLPLTGTSSPLQSLNPSDHAGTSLSSSSSTRLLSPSSSTSTQLSSSPLSLMSQNSSVGIGQEQANFEKTLFELLNSNPNISIPLSSEKYFWTFTDPHKLEPLFFHSLVPPTPAPAISSPEAPEMNSVQSNGQDSPKQDMPLLFYSDTDHLKVVSLCDKTLALLDYGKPKTSQLLRCELFDLEKNPESAYTEAKKTGIPIQSVSFREMREIINACRVLAEGEFNPNTVIVAPPPPSAIIANSQHTMDHFPLTAVTIPTGIITNNLNNTSSGSVSNSSSTSPTLTASTMSPSFVVGSGSSSSSSGSSPTGSSSSSSSLSSSSSSSSSSVVIPVSSSSSSSGGSPSVISTSQSSPSPSPSIGSPTVSVSSSPPSSSSTSSLTSDKGSSWMWSSWRALVPGTKWCGLGDSARNYFDLGKRKDVDVCCRAHDHCPIRLKALRMGYGLINLSLYTKSHCDCDEDFKRCLKQANSKSAEMLANFYFNIMKVPCIREDFPYVCKEYRKNKTTGVEECVRYEEDPAKKDKMVFVQPETVTF